uniref:transposase n=1 Tax=Trichocoleus desertorum TaxID=1481672 RepID=UPI0025B425DD|nr:transposase [Trichocoleus desertorum]
MAQAASQTVSFLYAFAAVAPAIGKLCSLILPWANTAMMNLFLAHLSLEFAQYFIILQLDQAGWHRAKHLAIPENIRLLPQPAYSPELMPVEHIWEEMREKHFYNRIFHSLDAVEATLCQALKNLMDTPEQVRSMTFFPHMRITL